MNQLKNWYLEVEDDCNTNDFLLIKVGDLNGTASSANFPYPNTAAAAVSNETASAKNNNTVKQVTPPAKSMGNDYVVSVYAKSDVTVSGYQFELWYDDEMVSMGQASPNILGLSLNLEDNFNHLLPNISSRTGRILRTVWRSDGTQGLRFDDLLNSIDLGILNPISDGALLFTVDISSDQNLEQVRQFVKVNDQSTTLFLGEDGQPITELDLEIFIRRR